MASFKIVTPLPRSAVSEVLASAVAARIASHTEITQGWNTVRSMAKADPVGLLTWWKNESVGGAFASAKALALAIDNNASKEALTYRGAFVVQAPTKAPKASTKAPKAPKAKAKAKAK